jgi:uncharacterized RDD family membrane protein YckC
MQYEDRMAVATPEGVTFEFTLAGVGSRFVAALIDGLLQAGLLLAIGLLAWALSNAIGGWAAVLFFVGIFAVYFGYDIAFETLASGRTPGKRWTGLRVVKVGGAPVSFMTSAIRNLLRLVDMLPTFYLIGIVSILATPKNQRLGDMAAGTIVVREKMPTASAPSTSSWTGYSAAAGGIDVSAWDVTAITDDELAAVRQFLSRRTSITREARSRLGREMASRLRPKVIATQESLGPETFLEGVVRAKSERGGE